MLHYINTTLLFERFKKMFIPLYFVISNLTLFDFLYRNDSYYS